MRAAANEGSITPPSGTGEPAKQSAITLNNFPPILLYSQTPNLPDSKPPRLKCPATTPNSTGNSAM